MQRPSEYSGGLVGACRQSVRLVQSREEYLWEADVNTMHRRNIWIAAIGALFAMAYPLAGAAAEDSRFEKLSVYLERNVQDHDAEIRFDVTGATDGLAQEAIEE